MVKILRPQLLRAWVQSLVRELRDETGHGRFGAQMRANGGEMAGNKVGGQSIYRNRWGLLYHTEDFRLFCCSWGTTEVV